MKFFSALVFALFLVVKVHANSSPDLEIPAIADIEAAVINRQLKYNADFDDSIIACGCNGTNSAICKQKVAEATSVFCTDGSFVSWVAPQPNPSTTPPTLTTVAEVVAYYTFLAGGVYANFSRHQISNARVTNVATNGRVITAELLAGLDQKAITLVPYPVPTYTENVGWYHNTYRVISLTPLEVCMTKFVSATDVNYVLLPSVPTPVGCGYLSTSQF